MLIEQDLALWAKTGHSEDGPAFHPLVYHMVDVGMVAQAIWQSALSPATRKELARCLGLPEADAAAWVSFVAGIHDIGKASPSFAYQGGQRERLERAGFAFVLRSNPQQHGLLSAAVLKDFLKAQGCNQPTSSTLATVVGGHHGTFPVPKSLINIAIGGGDTGNGAWRDSQKRLSLALFELFGLDGRQLPNLDPDDATGSMLVLSGIITMADWIGSDERNFPYSAPDVAIHEYARLSHDRAQEALRIQGWAAWNPKADRPAFGDLFRLADGTPMTPRPLQDAIITLSDTISDPSLVMVEAQMGEGKTEAALYMASFNEAVLGQRGCYFALPTQATSNQMLGRLRSFLSNTYPGDAVNLHLLHGHAILSDEYADLRLEGRRMFTPTGLASEEQDSQRARVLAAEWFTYRKRGLLAPFAVGTIDQALTAVLQTRHFFLRLYGLANKTVVIDEVHAYDAYMSTILERLIEWLARIGCSVVLLSATLPHAKRLRLVAAYHAGKGCSAPPLPDDVPYPRITCTNGRDAVHVVSFPTSERSRRAIQLQWVDGRAPSANRPSFPLGSRLQAALTQGGNAVVICNTVKRAQQVYRALKAHFPPEELDLFHARYPFGERAKREKRCLSQFGKDGERPHRTVLVATQVVEQSLDLDFDLMVTDLAPADLILQRAGRLHRHDRSFRPDMLRVPTLWICRPESVEDIPRFDPGTAAVYDHHTLLRTWLSLQKYREIVLPDDLEGLVESVYTETPCPQGCSEAIQSEWNRTRDELVREHSSHAKEAKDRLIPSPLDGKQVLSSRNDDLDEDNPRVTRRSGPSVSVVMLPTVNGVPLLDGEPLRLDVAPSMETVKKLLKHAVQLSDRKVIEELKNGMTPSGWTNSAMLSRYRLVMLDENGQGIGHTLLRLDPELGVVIGHTGADM